jgi:6-phosphogluconate dehydrogenase
MEIGMIGLGAMGTGMARRLLRHHRVVAYDRDQTAAGALAQEGVSTVPDLGSMVAALTPPRALWLMVPPGAPTKGTLDQLSRLLEAQDVVVDGGNSHFSDSAARASALAGQGIHLLDVGTSGGVGGAERGYALMVGGDGGAVSRMTPVFDSLAPDDGGGWGHFGPAGAGHFAKMVHNRVKHGMVQAYAEGLTALQANGEVALDLAQITGIWGRAAVVRSALLDLIHEALASNPELGPLAPYVADSGQSRRTAEHATQQIAEGGLDRAQFI